MFGKHEKYYCINFGGCYGYDLTVVFKEFLHQKCYFTNSNTAETYIDTFTFEYMCFLQQHYDSDITYQEKPNKKLMLKLIKIYNKEKHRKIKINMNKMNIITNVKLR